MKWDVRMQLFRIYIYISLSIFLQIQASGDVINENKNPDLTKDFDAELIKVIETASQINEASSNAINSVKIVQSAGIAVGSIGIGSCLGTLIARKQVSKIVNEETAKLLFPYGL